MKPIVALAAAGLSIATVAASQPYQLRFHGETTRDAVLIKDILRNIQAIMAARAKCDALQDVESRIAPPGYRPTPNTGPSAAAVDVHWELWTVTGCGVVKQFPTATWPDPNGGTMTEVVDEQPDTDPVAH